MGNGFTEEWYRERQERQTLQAARAVVARQAAEAKHVPPPAAAPKKARKSYPEEELQKQVAAFLDIALPDGFRWFHTPNQRGTRKRWENAMLKAMGVKAGVADVIILTPQRAFIWIELKAAKGVLSDDQKGWRDWCHAIRAPWFCCRSLDDVIVALTSLNIRLKARAS